MKKDIPKPVRVILFTAGVIWIAAMWAKKDIAATLAALPADGAIPMVIISLLITLLKVAVYTAVILLIKWLAGKLGGRKNEKQN